MALLGHIEDTLRLPMVPVSTATRRRLEQLMGELGLIASAPLSGETMRAS